MNNSTSEEQKTCNVCHNLGKDLRIKSFLDYGMESGEYTWTGRQELETKYCPCCGRKIDKCALIGYAEAAVKEFAEKLTKGLTKEVEDNPEAAASQYKAGLYFAMDLAAQYGKEEVEE